MLPTGRIFHSARRRGRRAFRRILVASEDRPIISSGDDGRIRPLSRTTRHRGGDRRTESQIADLEVSLDSGPLDHDGRAGSIGRDRGGPGRGDRARRRACDHPSGSVAFGENIRPVGVDLAKGSVVLQARKYPRGRGNGPVGRLGYRSGGGDAASEVSVLSTGNELVEPDETPGPGQIRDSNRFSLIAALGGSRGGGGLGRAWPG